MASRLNVKFVVTLAAVLVLAAGGVIVVGYMALLKSGPQNIALGDQQMAAGDYKTAAKYYSKAVHKDTTNGDWIRKWMSAMVKITPENRQEYLDKYSQEYVGAMAALAEAEPTVPESQRQFLEEIYRQYLVFGADLKGWENLFKTADRSVKGFGDRQDKAQGLRRYRGFARLGMVSIGAELPKEDLDALGEDLAAAVEADPKDHEAVVALAGWNNYTAKRALKAGEEAKAADRSKAATDLLEKYIRENPPAPAAVLTLTQLQLEQHLRSSKDPMTYAELYRANEPLLNRLIESVRAEDPAKLDTVTVTGVASMAGASPTLGPKVSADLLDSAVKARPDDPRLLLARARLALSAGDFEGSIGQFQKIVDLPDRPLSLDGMLVYYVRGEAIRQQIQAVLALWQQAKTAPERADLLKRAKDYREALIKQVSERDTSVLLVDAKIRYAEQDLTGARTLLAQYNAQTLSASPDAVALLGEIMVLQGNLGEARKQFQRLAEIEPGTVRGLMSLAAVEERLGNYKEAAAAYRNVLRQDKNNEAAAKQLAIVEDVSKGGGPTNAVVRALTKANDLATDINPDYAAAAAVLREALAGPDGNDVRLAEMLAQVLAMMNDRAGAIAAVDDALKKWPDDARLKAYAAALSNPDPLAAPRDAIEKSELPEARKHAQLYMLYLRAGKADLAQKELDAAIAADPKDEMVIELQFQRALVNKDTPTAKRLVEVAIARNLDHVNGLTYRARQELVEENYAAGAATLEQALSIDRLNVLAWRQLGLARLRLKQPDQALAAFGRALEIRPTDLPSIDGRLMALVGLGQNDQALALARESFERARGDPDFLEMWLQLEGMAADGDRAKALQIRRQLAARSPDNTANKLEMVKLLAAAKQWDEARTLLTELRKKEDSLILVDMDARLQAEQGKVGAGAQAYQDFINAIPPAKETDDMFIAMSRFLLDYGLTDPALDVLRQGRPHQNPVFRGADRAIADVQFDLGRLEDALASYSTVRDAGGKDTDNRLVTRMIECMILLKRFDQAQKTLQSLGAAVDTDKRLLLLAAETAAGQGDSAHARRLYDQCIALDPKDALGYTKRGEFSLRDPSTAPAAEADFKKALELAPRAALPLARLSELLANAGRWDEVIQIRRDALVKDPDNSQLRLSLAGLLLDRGHAPEAVDLIEGAIKRHPDDLFWFNRAAEVQTRLGHVDEAAGYYARVWEKVKTPDTTALYVNSMLRSSKKDSAKALEALSDPNLEVDKSVLLLITRAQVFLLIKDRQQDARADVTAAAALMNPNDPSSVGAFFAGVEQLVPALPDRLKMLGFVQPKDGFTGWAAWTMAQLKIQQPEMLDEGVSMLNHLAETSEDGRLKLQVYRVLGGLYYRQKKFEDAVTWFRKGVDLKPDDAELNNNLAYALGSDLGRPKDARPYAEKAVQISPRDAMVLDTLGAVLLALDELDQAQSLLDRAEASATTETSKAAIYLHQARLKLKKNDRAGASRSADLLEGLVRSNDKVREIYGADLELLKRDIGSK